MMRDLFWLAYFLLVVALLVLKLSVGDINEKLVTLLLVITYQAIMQLPNCI